MYLDIVRGEIALAEHRPQEAVSQLEAAMIVDPRSWSALESLAAALAAAGRVDDAVKRYEQIIAFRSLGNEGQEDWFRAHVRIGELYERAGQLDAARRSYERLLALWKDADPDLVALVEARTRFASLADTPPT